MLLFCFVCYVTKIDVDETDKTDNSLYLSRFRHRRVTVIWNVSKWTNFLKIRGLFDNSAEWHRRRQSFCLKFRMCNQLSDWLRHHWIHFNLQLWWQRNIVESAGTLARPCWQHISSHQIFFSKSFSIFLFIFTKHMHTCYMTLSKLIFINSRG